MKLNKVDIPNLINNDQVELAGAMFGDGNMCNKHNNTYVIRISGNNKKGAR